MRLRALFLALLAPSLALGAALLVCAPPRLRAFVLTGDSLDLGQRDVRVFDNFSDAQSHLNTTPDLRWPGATGPYLALWKAVAEWGSELHFEGHGDPHQPAGVGSGGANFDPSWQGAATDVGGLDDNTMSEISGSGAGVLAFCETPTSDGWRIRFYRQPWVWFDLPVNNTSNASDADLQGVACHEYGHALGLGHSLDGQATMYATLPFNEVLGRSIESDDMAGVRAIYGVRLPDKPHLASYELLGGGLVTLRGANFSPSGNTVWWTQAGSGGDGTPVQVANVASAAGGTELTLPIPPQAGQGDVLVQRAGSGHGDLSNAFPFSPLAGPCPMPVSYGTSKLSSQGSVPNIDWSGEPSATTADFRIQLNGAPSGARGILFYGLSPAAVPFYGGWMLVGPRRFRVKRFTADSFGFASIAIDVQPALSGVTRYYQFWYEDLGDPWGAGTSNALRVTLCD